MTPNREDEIRGAAETLQWARDADAAEMMLELLAALDEARRERDAALAREARLREAAVRFSRARNERTMLWASADGSLRASAEAAEAHHAITLDAALADPTAPTWLADRERAARAKALEEAAEESERDAERWGVESHSAEWLRNRAAQERGER